MRLVKILAIPAVLIVLSVFFFLFSRQSEPAVPVPLWQVTAPSWTSALGGEGEVTTEALSTFGDYYFGLDEGNAQDVRNVATLAALAQLTDSVYGDELYDVPRQPVKIPRTPRCRDTTLLAASPVGVIYDSVNWAKTAVVYTGKCGNVTYTKKSPGVEFVYAYQESGLWRPARTWQTPFAGTTEDLLTTDPGSLTEVICQNSPSGYLARPKVAAATAALCEAASRDDVKLTVTGGFRTASQQQEKYEEALDVYGTADQASTWVSFSDGQTCASRYCQGLAVTLEPEPAAQAWLGATSACLNPAGELLVRSSCTSRETVVTNAQRYGFATPPDSLPGYLEYVLPAGFGPSFTTEADCSPYGLPPTAVIAAVFRCRLSQEGVPVEQVNIAAATALAVAECASELNPQATVFRGEYAQEVKPGTGRTFNLGGLFGLSPTNEIWQSGDLGDPVASANYAAKVWLATRSFSQFFCATGADPDLVTEPVDEYFSSQAQLPKWTFTW